MPEFYHFDIPEPCHEDWNSMTPNEKGRFCSACKKSVVDFTQNTRSEISEYLSLHGKDGVCGRVTTKQLNYITLKIPASFITSRTRQQHIFILLLLLVMGTTLFSCTSDQGRKTKIDNVKVVGLDSLEVISCSFGKDVDSLYEEEEIPIVGGFGTPPPEPPELSLLGDISLVEGLMVTEEFYENQELARPRFINSPDFENEDQEIDYFNERLSQFVRENFEMSLVDSLNTDRVKILTQFTIDSSGAVKDITAQSNDAIMEKEAIRVLRLLPSFNNSSDNDFSHYLPIIIGKSK